MAITNYEVIQYTNDTVRVMAEKLRALKYEIDAAMTKYNSGIGAVCVADMAGIVEDGRESEGVSRLTGNDIVGCCRSDGSDSNAACGCRGYGHYYQAVRATFKSIGVVRWLL